MLLVKPIEKLTQVKGNQVAIRFHDDSNLDEKEVEPPLETDSDNELCYDDCTTISLDPEEMEANRIFCIQSEARDNEYYYECHNCEVVSTVRYPREFAKVVNDFVAYTKEKFDPLSYTDLMETCLDAYKDLKPGTKSTKGVYEERQLNKCSLVPYPNDFVCNVLAIVIGFPIMTAQW